MRIKLLVLILSTAISSYAQDTIYFKDGSTQTGKVIEMNKSVLKFTEEGTKKKKRYTNDDITGATILSEGNMLKYFYDKVPTIGTVLLTTVSSGKANLHVTESYMYGSYEKTVTADTYNSGGTIRLYYAKRDSEDSYFDLNYDGALVNKFKNRASKYLKDCPKLAKRIKNREFGKLDVEEIFEIYNNDCN
ncbi:MAG: RICIN domain-containing protein [Psychroserpens sp.]|uniref:hypothetical protein n=1 Tax=Psychroserpens sp. TaxID=2020870 RepID=UPI003C721B3C